MGETRTGRLPGLLCLVAAVGVAGCSGNRTPVSDREPVIRDGGIVIGGGDGDESSSETQSDGSIVSNDETGRADGPSTAQRYDIPPGFLPPPGQCRIWEPGEPAGQQKDRYPIGRCSVLRETISEGAWLVYRPTDDPKHVRVWQYGSEREVLFQRIYDIATGELIRHVAPASGN
jgi:hypothetical protein